jgi:hypothetical protein
MAQGRAQPEWILSSFLVFLEDWLAFFVEFVVSLQVVAVDFIIDLHERDCPLVLRVLKCMHMVEIDVPLFTDLRKLDDDVDHSSEQLR